MESNTLRSYEKCELKMHARSLTQHQGNKNSKGPVEPSEFREGL